MADEPWTKHQQGPWTKYQGGGAAPAPSTAPAKPPPRQPYWDRLGAAASAVGKDATESPLDAAGEVLNPAAGPLRYGLRVGGDLFNLGMAATGIGAAGEHIARHDEAVHGPPKQLEAPWYVKAGFGLNPSGPLAVALLNDAASKKTPEERAKAVGDIAETTASFLGPDILGAGSDYAKISKIAKEFKVSRATAEAMLKAGEVKRTKVLPPEKPGIIQRTKNVVGDIASARKAAREGDFGAGISDADRARGEKLGQDAVRREVLKRDPTGKLLTQNPAEAMGKPTTSAEALGPTAEARLGATARREGATGGALKGQLGERLYEAPQRIQEDFERASGSSLAEIEGNFRTANREARSAHAAEYAKVNPQVVPNSEELTTILARPPVRDALREAYDLARGDDVNPEHIGLIVSNTKQVVRNAKGELEVALHTEPIEVRHPTIQTLDYLRRGLQEQLEKFRDPITKKLNLEGPKAVQIVRSLDQLRDLMFKASPDYEALLAKVGDPIRQGEAFDDAPKLFKNQTSEFKFNERVNGRLDAKTGKRVGGMSDPEKRALLAGAMNDIFTRLRGTGLTIRQVLTPAYRSKIETLVGKDRAAELFTRLEEEARGHEAATRMYPTKGSGTFGWASAAHETDQDLDMAGHVVKHAPHIILSGGHTAPHAILDVLRDMTQKGLDLRRAPINEAARDEIGRLLMMKPSDLHKYLSELYKDPATVTKIERLFSGSGRQQLMRAVAVSGQAQKQGQQ